MNTRVKFVNLEGSVLALFPDEIYNRELFGKTQIMSYMHNGQHGPALYGLMRRKSLPKEKYLPLKKELESIGYALEVLK